MDLSKDELLAIKNLYLDSNDKDKIRTQMIKIKLDWELHGIYLVLKTPLV